MNLFQNMNWTKIKAKRPICIIEGIAYFWMKGVTENLNMKRRLLKMIVWVIASS